MAPVQLRVKTVLARMSEMALANEEDAEMFAEALEPMLNELRCEDAFGTEAQCDPRGDGREDNWSMTRVQGVDA